MAVGCQADSRRAVDEGRRGWQDRFMQDCPRGCSSQSWWWPPN